MAVYRSYQNDPIKRKAREAWHNMKYRCYNPNAKKFHRYGGRGIKICEEWLHSFLPFYEWSLSNGIAPGLTIDRIDNDGDYCPQNCRWVTRKTQMNNTSKNVFVEFGGERKTIQQWAETLGITHQGLADRLSSGEWSVEGALTTPPGKGETKHPAACVKVVQLSLDGNPLRVWGSVTEAAASVNAPTSNISRSLATGGTARGYRWEYAEQIKTMRGDL